MVSLKDNIKTSYLIWTWQTSPSVPFHELCEWPFFIPFYYVLYLEYQSWCIHLNWMLQCILYPTLPVLPELTFGLRGGYRGLLEVMTDHASCEINHYVCIFFVQSSLTGWVAGVAFVLWIAIGSMMNSTNKDILPVPTAKCNNTKLMNTYVLSSLICSYYVWTSWSKYFCLDIDTFIILCRGLCRVFIQSTSNIGTMILSFCGGVLWLFWKLFFSGFIHDLLVHQLLIDVWLMMYISWVYNALFFPEFLSNQLQTFAQWSLCFGEVCYDLSLSYVMFFGIYSWFSGSLCGSKLLQ